MEYNLHPLFVHFPIALLFSYSLIKLLPFEKWFPEHSLRRIGRSFLFIGFTGALFSLSTGETAEHLTHYNKQIIEIHSTFAGIATLLYGILLAGELSILVNAKSSLSGSLWKTVKRFSLPLERILSKKLISKMLVLLAFISIILTGLFGGAIVYGVSSDPIAPYLLNIFGVTM